MRSCSANDRRRGGGRMRSLDSMLDVKHCYKLRWVLVVLTTRLEASVYSLQQANMSVPDLLHVTRDWLGNLQAICAAEKAHQSEPDNITNDIFTGDSHTLAALARRADDATRELESIETQRRVLTERIEQHFDEFRTLPYRLAAVFIHRGTASFGHYWIYIYDFRRNIWRKYNDGYVTEVYDTAEIFGGGPSEGGGRGVSNQQQPQPQNHQQQQQQPYQPQYLPTPYYLVYVKDDIKDELIDPVCREPDCAVLIEEQHSNEQVGVSESVDIMTVSDDDDAQHDSVSDSNHDRNGHSNGNGTWSSNDNDDKNGGNEEVQEVQMTEMKERPGGTRPAAVDEMYWSANRTRSNSGSNRGVANDHNNGASTAHNGGVGGSGSGSGIGGMGIGVGGGSGNGGNGGSGIKKRPRKPSAMADVVEIDGPPSSSSAAAASGAWNGRSRGGFNAEGW